MSDFNLQGRTLFRASRNLWNDSIDLGIGNQRQDGALSIATQITMRTIAPGEAAPSAVLRLTYAEAQELVDELWNAGLRPSEGTGSAGSLAATQRHLEDMQGIAIGLLRQQGVDL